MPLPGVKSVPESMSAVPPLPRARIAARASAFVWPAGISRPMIPAKTRSVALPRIFGPSTDSATLTTPRESIAYIVPRSGLNCDRSRLPDPLKSIER